MKALTVTVKVSDIDIVMKAVRSMKRYKWVHGKHKRGKRK